MNKGCRSHKGEKLLDKFISLAMVVPNTKELYQDMETARLLLVPNSKLDFDLGQHRL